MSKITVFTKPACVQCISTKRWLDKLDIEYDTVDISLPENADALAKIKDLGYMAAPVVTVETPGEDDKHWYGFRPDLIEPLAA